MACVRPSDPQALGTGPLSANVRETPTPREFSVQGETGFEDVDQPEGPERCSGLPVVRYSPEEIYDQFGGQFVKVGSDSEVHHAPWGSEQEFVYCYCRLSS